MNCADLPDPVPTCARAGEDGPCWGEVTRVAIPQRFYCAGHLGSAMREDRIAASLGGVDPLPPYRPDPITLAGARAWWDAHRHLRDNPARPEYLPPWDALPPLEQLAAAGVTEALFVADKLRREGLPHDAEPGDFAAVAVMRELGGIDEPYEIVRYDYLGSAYHWDNFSSAASTPITDMRTIANSLGGATSVLLSRSARAALNMHPEVVDLQRRGLSVEQAISEAIARPVTVRTVESLPHGEVHVVNRRRAVRLQVLGAQDNPALDDATRHVARDIADRTGAPNAYLSINLNNPGGPLRMERAPCPATAFQPSSPVFVENRSHPSAPPDVTRRRKGRKGDRHRR